MSELRVRKARMQDIPAMARLINDYAAQEIMLPRNEMELAESIRDFSVAELVSPGEPGRAELVSPGEPGRAELVGCVALHFYTTIAGEVRSLAVDPAHARLGIGRKLVEALEVEARDCDLATLFAFTYVPGFFSKLGYDQVDRNLLPLKAWKDCLRCPKFQNCDEIAVLKRLKEIELRPFPSAGNDTRDLVQLPTPRS